MIARAEIDVAKEVDRPPPIIQLGPVNQTLPIQTSASLPCQASGDETISWLRDGVPLSTLVDRRYLVDGDNTLSIKSKKCSLKNPSEKICKQNYVKSMLHNKCKVISRNFGRRNFIYNYQLRDGVPLLSTLVSTDDIWLTMKTLSPSKVSSIAEKLTVL